MELEQLEALALSTDRERALAQLIPGTEDYYFHRCLEHLHRGELDATEPLFAAWVERHGETARVRELRDRRALLAWEGDPAGTCEHVRRRLGVTFTHQREVEHPQSNLPTRLDPAWIDRAAFLADALRHRQDVEGFEDRAFEWLISAPDLDLTRLRSLLQRLTRPDYPGLVELIARELADRHSSGFGSVGIHTRLTLAQLDRLAALCPQLREHAGFVEARIARLLPGSDVDLDEDLDARAAHLAALWAYVEPLVPAFNSLKLHVLYHQLELDRRRGVYDRASFERYIQLPRNARNVSSEQLYRHRDALGELHRDYRPTTGLAPIHDDAELVLDYLFALFSDPAFDDHLSYAKWLDGDYLRRVFAKTKILTGQGDAERWYSLLDDPNVYKSLEERVEITLAPQNPRRWAADQPVELLVDVKRVSTLIIKVFEINPLAYFLAHGREVDGAVDLDGLVANDERILELDAPALRRVRHTLRFDSLARPGTFVIELIGGGKSSRALIRKGALGYIERRTAAGHALTILDEGGQPVAEASAWFGGREFRPDQGGEVRIPYGAGGQARVLLRAGSRSSVVSLELAAERYEFQAGIHVEREQLIAGAAAEVVIATTLTLAGVVVDPSLIRDPSLTISSEDRHGISSSMTVPLTLDAKAEAIHRFAVPEALRRLSFEVRGKVRSVTEQRDVELSASSSIGLNELDLGSEVADLHLSKTAGGHLLHVLGKSGEPRAGVEVAIAISHLDFRSHMHMRLQTDARGRIELGELLDIRGLQATLPSGRRREWTLNRPDFRLAAELHTIVGRELVLPRPSGGGGDAREVASLLERCGAGYRRDRSDALSLDADGLGVRGLEVGDYELVYKRDGQRTLIRVGKDRVVRGWSLGDRRQLELGRSPQTLRVIALSLDDAELRVQLGGVSSSTRLHVFARRFVPDRDALAALDHAQRRGPGQLPIWRARSSYLSGRDIGDEYRYILDRRRAEVFAGTMLERPGLLLNPWALRTTSTELASAAAGGAYAAADEPSPDFYASGMAMASPQAAGSSSSNLDFLAAPACVALNLEPDADGCVTIPREQLGDCTLIRAVAVDPSSLAAAELALPESELEPRDRRLLDALDASKHYVLRKQRACLAGDAELVIDDLRTAKLEAVDSVGKAHALLSTLSSDAHLREFEFVTRWPSLSPEDQRERYSKYACHELHLFLARKDPEFFAAVVQPYLANKRDQTFMDHYLLGEPLDRYLEPWAYGRLNVLEKILLAERVAGERGPGARHVRDRFDLLPPDVEGDNAAFDTALQGSALASEKSAVFAAPAAEAVPVVGGFGGPPRGGSPGFGPPPPPAAAPAPAAPRAPSPARMAKRSAPAKGRAKEAMDLEMDADEGMLRDDLSAREEVRRFFQPLDKTQEWAENNYYRRRIAEQGPELIQINRFWRDFAEHVAAGSPGPFLSGHFVRATSCFAEMLCALAVLDLPFVAEPPVRELHDARASFRPSTSLIVFHEQIAAVEPSEQRLGVLVSQNYFQADDRYRYEDNERHDKYVVGEFLIHTVYICQVVLTNPSSSAHKLDLLVQIPRGAVPVGNGFETRDLHIHLAPRGTHAIEYSFYFPGPGRFEHFPVHVAKHEALVVFAEPTTLEVVSRRSSVDTDSWSQVSQRGTDAELLAYLEANNIDRLALERIAWRMRDPAMFEATLALLRRRHVYSDVLWSYALHHAEPVALGEYLRAQDHFVRGCGLALDSTLVRTEPVERRWYQHLEYAPLVNARAHQLGSRRKILNSALEAQYRGFLQTLTYYPRASDDQLVAAAYHALLQDRVREALQLLERIDPARVTGQLQWDYLQAYVALYRDDVARARELAERHHEHPVPRWRKRFANLAAILAEAEGAAAAVVDADDRQQQQAKLAATEASFDFEVEGQTLVLSHQNLTACQLSFYRMDIELLFSRQPFMQDQSDRFAIVEPNVSQRLELSESPLRIELPAELRSANTIIEVVAGGVRRSKANYAHDLAVRMIEQYGQLRVHERSSGRALARAYVKVYARKHGGGVDFYKDGYTDLRGAFDYASLSTNELDHVERFAILVMSDDRGALIREVAPPQR